MGVDYGSTVELLRELTEAVGISGQEAPVRAILRRHLAGKADELYTDRVGNLIARKGAGPLKVVVEGHTDEVGGMVSEFHPEGYLGVRWNGYRQVVLSGRRVWVGKDRLPGVIGSKALHLIATGERDKPPGRSESWVDMGFRTKAEAMARVDYGDPVVLASRLERWGERVVKAKALDDRAGCALTLEAFLGADCPNLTLYAVFPAAEEIGCRGTRAYGGAIRPDVGIVLECTSAGDGPAVEDRDASARMGAGPVLSLVDNGLVYDPGLLKTMTTLADEAGIPWQYRRLTTAGNDAGPLAFTGSGVRTTAISLPGRYIHSAHALLNLADYDHARRLLGLLLAALNAGPG